MLDWFRRRTQRQRKARELYGAVVAQARKTDFYAVHGAPDTLEGRYEMIVMHLFLLLERFRREGQAAADVSRLIAEQFVAEMDTEMREMGVGDLAVPRKVKRAAAGLIERSRQYRQALGDTDEGLLARLLAEIVPPERANALADYIRRAAATLDQRSYRDIVSGDWAFPPPLTSHDEETT